jgi:hypothetical protein
MKVVRGHPVFTKEEKRKSRRAWDRAIWVDVDYTKSIAIPRDRGGLERLSEFNRRRRSDPVMIAKRSGRDVIDVRTRRPWDA